MARHVLIIGNGIAGTTAARHVRKLADHEITIISAETDHFFSRTALMYIYMGHMSFEDTKPYADSFWSENRIRLLRAWVEKVDSDAKRVHLDGGRRLGYDTLIIASGSLSNKFGWPGQDLFGVQGLYSYQDLQLMEECTRDLERAVVVGGGLIGVETAEMLHSRQIPVTFLVREPSWMDFAFRDEESRMINRHIREHGIDLRLGSELERIEGDARGRVRGVVTKSGEDISCGFVALTVGVSPNVGFLAGSGIECDRGVLVDEQLRTNKPDVFAIGDCAQLRRPATGRRAIEPVWYTGRRMGQTVARTICDEPTAYDQGIWFNSAKFFDLEWQVYGDVPATVPHDADTLYWEHPGGAKSVRVDFRRSDQAVLGFNLMGIRYRHEVCDAWIREGRPIRGVLQDLGAANFDPELCPQHERQVIDAYNRAYPGQAVTLHTRRGLRGLLARTRAS